MLPANQPVHGNGTQSVVFENLEAVVDVHSRCEDPGHEIAGIWTPTVRN